MTTLTSLLKRTATAVWSGPLKDGIGNLTTPSGILHSTQYSFGSRFETGPGINPEELIAAAHAGCYAMTLSGALEEAGFPAERLEVTAEITADNSSPPGWTLTSSHLAVTARVPEIDPDQFRAIAEEAKDCPISRALTMAVTLNARLI